jgi:hypothetical protein
MRYLFSVLPISVSFLYSRLPTTGQWRAGLCLSYFTTVMHDLGLRDHFGFVKGKLQLTGHVSIITSRRDAVGQGNGPSEMTKGRSRRAGEGIRTLGIQLGKLTFYH